MRRFIAIDLGAESGRVIVGTLTDERLALEELHRFANIPVELHGSIYWDVLHLFAEIKAGLARAAQRYGPSFDSIGVSTWGIDFALLDTQGELVGNPHSYRDSRTAGVLEEVLALVPAQEIYEASGGIQFMGINTLYQLRSMVCGESPLLAAAAHFVMIPDLINYWLTGRICVEYTNATSTQFYDSARSVGNGIARACGNSHAHFGDVVASGSVLGPLLPAIAARPGLAPYPSWQLLRTTQLRR